MYAYFVDEEASARHRRDLDRLDLSLTERGIAGRKIYLSRLSDVGASIAECLAAGAKTLVAVGSDATVSRLVNALARPGEGAFSGAALGVLPIGEHRTIARAIGCAEMPLALDALARHHVERLDLGTLNSRHCFLGAAIFPKNVSLSFLSYRVSSLRRDHHVSVCNMNIYAKNGAFGKKVFNPSDSRLEAVIAYRPRTSWWSRVRLHPGAGDDFVIESVFPIQNITVMSKQKTISVVADAEKRLSTPVAVAVVPAALPVVVRRMAGA